MRSDQVRLKRGDAFPLLNHYHNVFPLGALHRQAAGNIGRREVLDAAGFRPHLGDDLAKLVEERRPLAGVQLDGGEDDNHALTAVSVSTLAVTPRGNEQPVEYLGNLKSRRQGGTNGGTVQRVSESADADLAAVVAAWPGM